MLALYNQEKRDIRRVSHKAPAIDYGKFVDILKKTTPEMAVWNMRQWKLHAKGKKKGYDKQSKCLLQSNQTKVLHNPLHQVPS